jgi:type II secretory pathway pseudopilin PulG
LIVFSIVGLLALVAGPRARAYRDTSAVRAARLEIVAVTEAARAAALQRGRTARVVYRLGVLTASVDTSAVGAATTASMVTLALQPLTSAYGVTVTTRSPADTLIGYDARGLADPRRSEDARLYVQRGGARDSVCVTQLGMILPRGCAL